MWMFKLFNINTQALTLMQQLMIYLKHEKNDALTKEITLILWSDILNIYNFLSKEYIELKEDWAKFNYVDFMQFFEINNSIQNFVQNLEVIYQNKKLFDRDNFIKEPKWLKFEKKELSELQNQMNQMKLNIPSTRRSKRNISPCSARFFKPQEQ